MSFNWTELFTNAIDAAEKAARPMAPQIKDYLKEIAKSSRDTLEDLTRALARGEIDKATFDAELEGQKLVLGAEMAAIKVMAKAAAQKAANAFINSINSALKAAIKAAVPF